VHEADPGIYFESVAVAKNDKDGKLATDEAGKMLTVRKQRPKLINDLPLEARKLIEDVTVDKHANYVPRLYSKAQANADLRKLLNIGAQEHRPENDVARLSDAELIQQLADQAKQLGVEIKLDYSFAQQPPAAEAPNLPAGETIEHDVTEADAKAADVTSAAPGVSNATVSKARGANPLASPEPVTSHEFAGARQIKGGRR
jgi:hypothetical protein